MKMYGYGGNILYVDLTDKKIRKEPLDPELVRTFIGGSGFTQRLAYDHIPPDTDPFSPKNAIIVGAGLFSGTIVPGSSELSITFKSPLNGAICTSNGGGSFPLMLKSSGYDAVVIYGRADKPVYLKILNDDVELCDARDLWGLDNYDTTDNLRKKYEPCSIIPISSAGENLVRISLTFIDKGGTVGFGGLPAVMGSKNLKAMVACLGDRGVEVADPLRLQRVVDKMLERIMGYYHLPTLHEGGTFSMTKGWAGMAAQLGGIDLDRWDEIHRTCRKGIACPSCPIGDKDRINIGEGEYAPSIAYMTDFMGEVDFSTDKGDLDRYNRAIIHKDRMNRDGICRFNSSAIMMMLASLYEKGIITKEEIGGLEPTGMFPDYVDHDASLELIHMISHREGIGDLLAEGGLRVAEKIGKGAERYLLQIKGFGTYFPLDPRIDGFHTMNFSQMVFPGRTHYAPGGIGIYMPGRSIDEHIKQAQRIGMTEEEIDRIFSPDSYNVGRLTKHAYVWYSLFNCCGQCHRLYIHRFYGIKNIVDLYSAITGLEVTPADLLKVGERAWNMYKIVNIRTGFGRKDDRAPDMWFEPVKMGGLEMTGMVDYFGHTINRKDTERAIDEYYDEFGWDRETGFPTLEKLKELGLERFFSKY